MNIIVKAKDKNGDEFTANLTPKKNAKINLDEIKRSFEKMGMVEVSVKYGRLVAK